MGNRNIVDKDMITWHTDTEKISAVQSTVLFRKALKLSKSRFHFMKVLLSYTLYMTERPCYPMYERHVTISRKRHPSPTLPATEARVIIALMENVGA